MEKFLMFFMEFFIMADFPPKDKALLRIPRGPSREGSRIEETRHHEAGNGPGVMTPKIDFSGGRGYPLGEKTRLQPKEIGMNIFGLGLPELLVILFIVILLFGGKKLGSIGKSLGEGIRGFKESVKGEDPNKPKNPEPPKN
jgi:sec-independent protein translocase protein TatA